jgi:hypothetical protein
VNLFGYIWYCVYGVFLQGGVGCERHPQANPSPDHRLFLTQPAAPEIINDFDWVLHPVCRERLRQQELGALRDRTHHGERGRVR